MNLMYGLMYGKMGTLYYAEHREGSTQSDCKDMLSSCLFIRDAEISSPKKLPELHRSIDFNNSRLTTASVDCSV